MAYYYRPSSVLCLSVGCGLGVGPRNHILDGGPDRLCKGAIFGERTCQPTCHPSWRQMHSSDASTVVALSYVGTSAFIAMRGNGLANIIQPSVFHGDAVFYQITSKRIMITEMLCDF